MSDPAPNEIVVRYPNGGERIKKTQKLLKMEDIRLCIESRPFLLWGGNPDVNKDEDWIEIAKEVANVDSFLWTPLYFRH